MIRHTISFRVAVALVVMSILPLFILSEVLLTVHQHQVEESEFLHITHLADKKITQIDTYIKERMSDIEVLAEHPYIQRAMKNVGSEYYKHGIESDGYLQASSLIDELTRNFLAYGYYDLFLISTEGDIVYTVVHEDDYATNILNGPYAATGLGKVARDALSGKGESVSSFDYYPPSDEAAAFLSIPVFENQKLIGALALQIDIEAVFAVVADNVGLGRTGEVLIGERELNGVRIIDPLSFHSSVLISDSASESDGVEESLRKALSQQNGHGMGINLKGESILAAWRYLPVLSWGIVVSKQSNEAFSNVQDMQRLIYLLLVVLFFIGLVLAYVVANTVARPIKQLTVTAAAIAKGALDQRVEPASVEEVGQLARSFNHMLDALEATHAKLREKVVEAESANSAKTKFLSQMSHELRTPMNAILGFAQVLELDSDEFNHEQQENIQEILKAGNHLLNMINDVLEVSRIESGNILLENEEIDIATLIEDVFLNIKADAVERNIALINAASEQRYCVKGDSEKLKQVLLNLLSNAVKYNREEGLVTVMAQDMSNGFARISVIDQGKGLTEEQISRLFVPFERQDIVNNVNGIGLGLVLVRQLVSLMGGNIGVESKPGDGSVFWIELELAEGR